MKKFVVLCRCDFEEEYEVEAEDEEEALEKAYEIANDEAVEYVYCEVVEEEDE